MTEIPYNEIMVTVSSGLLIWVLKEQRRQCNLLTKITTALIMKFPDLRSVLK